MARRQRRPPPVALTARRRGRRARWRRVIAWPRRARVSRARRPRSRCGARPSSRPSRVSGGYTRTNHVDEFGVPQPIGGVPLAVDLSRHSRQLLHARVASVADLHRRTDRRARARGRGRSARRRRGPRRRRAPICGSKSCAPTGRWSPRARPCACCDEALDRADAHLRDVRAMFEAGLMPPNDVSSGEAQRSRQQLQLIEAQNLRRSVAEDLRRLTGVPSDAEIAIRPPLAATSGAGSRRPAGSSAAGRDGAQAARRAAGAARADRRRRRARDRRGGRAQADGRVRRRRRLRQPQSAHLSARGRVAGVVGGRR